MKVRLPKNNMSLSKIQENMKNLDKNKDGFLSKDEMPLPPQVRPENAPAAPAETEAPAAKKSGCGSFVGGGLIVLVTILGSAWAAKRR